MTIFRVFKSKLSKFGFKGQNWSKFGFQHKLFDFTTSKLVLKSIIWYLRSTFRF